MDLDDLHDRLEELTRNGLEAISQSSFGVDGCSRSVAYFDSRKDHLFTSLESFQPASEALGQLAAVRDLFGSEQANRLAIQFVFNACRLVADGLQPVDAFEHVWSAFKQEVAAPTWTYRAVANMQNIDCSKHPIELTDGVSVRGRSFDELSHLLNWDSVELDYLTKDWMEGSSSSFVLLIEREFPKTLDNFLLSDDGSAHPLAARSLLAMRLLAPGDVRIGKVFLTRPAAFNVGLGGISSTGYSVWHPGPVYTLTPENASTIQQLCRDLLALEEQSDNRTRNLFLALRSFSSIYDRRFHEAEDRIVDAVTALEALWKIEAELSFRLAFRTASLLAASDDERVSLYKTLTDYYKIRSKIVHGGLLNKTQERQLREAEPLRDIVRRTLRAFVHLALKPGAWTLGRLYEDVDRTLIHAAKRAELRSAMGIHP